MKSQYSISPKCDEMANYLDTKATLSQLTILNATEYIYNGGHDCCK